MIKCSVSGCEATYQSVSGLRYHTKKHHPTSLPSSVPTEQSTPVVKNGEIGEKLGQLERELASTNETMSFLVAQMTEMQDQLRHLVQQNSKVCVVCYAAPNDFAFDPCGHKTMCEDHAAKYIGRGCPFCQKLVAKVLRIYEGGIIDDV